MPTNLKTILYISIIILLIFIAIYFIPTKDLTFPNNSAGMLTSTSTEENSISTTTEEKKTEEEYHFELPTNFEVTHLETPEIVKGVYITENTFADVSRMNQIISFASSTEMNTALIDIGSDGGPIFNIKQQIALARLSLLHSKGIYLIARIVTLNDEEGGWHAPDSEERRETLARISKEAIESGFDEINFDYIRYPGPSEPQKFDIPVEERISKITDLFKFLKENVRDKLNHPISIDIFGSTFIYPEKNIGQDMEEASKYFDYMMPMPYPSHWADWTFGYEKPGEHPYEVVLGALTTGWNKVKNNPEKISELRIWVQDFNLRTIAPITYLEYTPKMIHEQIYACYEVDCSGWVLWNPNNTYSKEVLTIPPNPNINTETPTTTSATVETSTTTTSDF